MSQSCNESLMFIGNVRKCRLETISSAKSRGSLETDEHIKATIVTQDFYFWIFQLRKFLVQFP